MAVRPGRALNPSSFDERVLREIHGDEALSGCRCPADRGGRGGWVVVTEAHDEWQTTDRRYLSEATVARLIARPSQDAVATPELMTA